MCGFVTCGFVSIHTKEQKTTWNLSLSICIGQQTMFGAKNGVSFGRKEEITLRGFFSKFFHNSLLQNLL
jgi:hypothetical protein